MPLYSRWSFLFFKQKTAYEMRISYLSSDVCSSDLAGADDAFELRLDHVPDVAPHRARGLAERPGVAFCRDRRPGVVVDQAQLRPPIDRCRQARMQADVDRDAQRSGPAFGRADRGRRPVETTDARAHVARSEEHT